MQGARALGAGQVRPYPGSDLLPRNRALHTPSTPPTPRFPEGGGLGLPCSAPEAKGPWRCRPLAVHPLAGRGDFPRDLLTHIPPDASPGAMTPLIRLRLLGVICAGTVSACISHCRPLPGGCGGSESSPAPRILPLWSPCTPASRRGGGPHQRSHRPRDSSAGPCGHQCAGRRLGVPQTTALGRTLLPRPVLYPLPRGLWTGCAPASGDSLPFAGQAHARTLACVWLHLAPSLLGGCHPPHR